MSTFSNTMGYRAFFSYARADERAANWLHRQLDSFRTPRDLVGREGMFGPVPEKLHPIFRDRTDLPGGGHLGERIKAALEGSDALIVLCSPNSAQSEWVDREVEFFASLGRANRIFPVIASSLSDSNDIEAAFYPPALRDRGLLAADMREIRVGGRRTGDGRQAAKLKTIAGLLGVELDQILRRDRQRRFRSFAIASAVLTGVLALAVLVAVRSLEVRESRQVASEETVSSRLVRSAQALREHNYPLAFRIAADAMDAHPDHAERFLPQLRLLAFLTRGATYIQASDATIVDAAIAPNGRVVASVDQRVLRAIHLASDVTWQLQAGGRARWTAVAVNDSSVAALSDRAPGQWPQTAEIAIFDNQNGHELRRFPAVLANAAIALSSNGQLIALCSPGLTVVYSVASGQERWRRSLGPEMTDGAQADCLFDSADRRVATFNAGTFGLFDAETGEIVSLFGSESYRPRSVRGPYYGLMDVAADGGYDAELDVSIDVAALENQARSPLRICEFLPTSFDAVANFFSDLQIEEPAAGTWRIRRAASSKFQSAQRALTITEHNYLVAWPLRDALRENCVTSHVTQTLTRYGRDGRDEEAALRRLLSLGMLEANGAADLQGWDASPDGRYVAAIDRTNAIVVYDASLSRVVSRFSTTRDSISLVMFPNADFLFSQGSATTEVWDSKSGILLATLDDLRCEEYCGIALSEVTAAPTTLHFTFDMGDTGEGELAAPEFDLGSAALEALLCERLFADAHPRDVPRSCSR